MLQILARHWASRKIWSTKFPGGGGGGGGGKPYPASGLNALLHSHSLMEGYNTFKWINSKIKH